MSLPPTTFAWSRPLQPPAYNAVSPRSTLQPASDSPDPGVTAPKAKKVEWPPAVREYVRRAFDVNNAIPGISSAEMQAKLKETISYYAERNAHDEVHWPTYPLPQELLQEERRKAALASANDTSTNGPPHGFLAAHMNDVNGQANQAMPSCKKRKSQDGDALQALPAQLAPPGPWRKTNLESRITYPERHKEKRHKKNGLAEGASKLDQAELEKRRQRFHLGAGGSKASPPWGSKDEDEMSMAIIIGTNPNLEKSYFRLTAPPKAETVRPLPVLEKTLALLTKKWKAEKNYNYICNQFKSLRQDLTVQHIKNAFTVKVYEIHARISLEKGDLGEYNQCQTQLKALYAQNLGGNPAEFTAYRILYFVYTCNKTDMNDLLAELTVADKGHAWIQHALEVRSSLALGNYHKFFRLYLEAQNMGGYLMDMFIERERFHALANLSRGYLTVALRFLTDELGFENDEACREFLASHGAQMLVEQKEGQAARVNVREGAPHFERLRGEAFSKVDIKGQL